LLDLEIAGERARFAGDSFGSLHQKGREVAIRESGRAGLNVVRKLFVSRTGYFARYLEVLTNPTPDPIDVNVRLTSHFRFIQKTQFGFRFDREPRIIASSSGDGLLDISDPDARDHWVEIDDDDDGDPFLVTTLPPVAHVFDGPGAPLPVAEASYAIDFGGRFGRLVNGWRSVTVPPGGIVTLMHFATEQTGRDAAQASAERLVQLPPEAFEGASVPDLIAEYRAFWSYVQFLSSVSCGPDSADAHSEQADALLPQVEALLGSSDVAEVRRVASQVRLLAEAVHIQDAISIEVISGESRCILDGELTRRIASEMIDVASDLFDVTFVQNFAVPVGGQSALAPLPSLAGRVTGQVLGSDGATPVAGARVAYRSAHPIYSRTRFAISTSPSATFAFQGSFSAPIVPVDDFTLQATHPQTGVVSPLTPGTFPGDTAALQNVVFGNTGTISGFVRRTSAVVISAGSVLVTGAELPQAIDVPIAADGRYAVTGLKRGDYLLSASQPHAQGSSLAGLASTRATEGSTTPLDITIEPTGGAAGLVRRGSGAIVPDLPVSLRQGLRSWAARTDTGGRFTFIDAPIGSHVLETFEAATNTAARADLTVAADQVANQDLTLAAGGTVAGIVTLGATTPAAGALVTLTSATGVFSTTTAPNGSYEFNQVTPGTVVVRATHPPTGLQGVNTGSFGLSGETLTLDLQLFAGGTVTGTVRRFGGVIPAGGVDVTINRTVPAQPSTVRTDALGRYTFNLVPLGEFTADALDPTTGDRGRTTSQLNANGETRVVDIVLNGQGRVIVTVNDSANNPAGGVQVHLSSQTMFGGTLSSVTDGEGRVTFVNVLAGAFSVSAFDPVTFLSAFVNGSVTAGGETSLTLRFQASGTILGTVLAPDGSTQVSGATVRASGPVHRETNTGADGSYRFEGVPVGTYTLDAIDGAGRIRARATGVVLTASGDLVVRNLTFLGLGAVTGVVRDPEGNPVFSVSVSLRGNGPVGGFFAATTDTDGSYRIFEVPVGPFVASAVESARNLLGETLGRVNEAGETVTADIQLLDNSVLLPVFRYDGSDFYFDVQGDGSVRSGVNAVFAGDFGANFGSFFLDVVSQGTPNRFTGGSIGTLEDGGREIAVRQPDLAGLAVTRKAFVAPDGYFVRYLEILGNATADPITVDVRVQNNLRSFSTSPRVIATSSGDAVLDLSTPGRPDRWVTVDDGSDGDPFQVFTMPSTAFVFDGPGAATGAGAASFSASSFLGDLSYQWNGVVIPPGGTAAFLHFGVQQTGRAAAQASAERLIQLPPEALAGLSAEELSSIRNFAPPPGGVSTLPPMVVTGSVNGLLLEGDAQTVVPFASVRFRSNNPLYGRTHFLNTDAGGRFEVTASFQGLDFGGHVAVPLEPFTLTAAHPTSGAPSPTVAGNFDVGQTTAVRHIVFDTTGLARGTVRRRTGAAVADGGSVRVTRSNPFFDTFVSIAPDGGYVAGGLSAGTYALTAFASHPQGSSLTGTTTASVAVGAATFADITLEATGNLTGIVRTGAGQIAPNVFVQLRNASFTLAWSTVTDDTGRYTLSNVPAGTFLLQAFEPATFIATSIGVTIVEDQTSSQDVMLSGLGTVEVQVNLGSGSPAQGSQVQIMETGSSSFRFVGQTDSAGRLSIFPALVGMFTVRAFHPDNGALFTDVTGMLVNNGDTTAVTIMLPGTGIVSGRVTFGGGAVAPNVTVQAFDSATFSHSTQTDSGGNYTLTQITVGRPFSVHAFHPADAAVRREVTGNMLDADGQTLTLDLALPALASVRVTVLRADGTPFAGARVEARNSVRTSFRSAGTTDASGVLTIPNVPEGAFSVLARDPSTSAFAGSANGTVEPADDLQTIAITINAPLTGTVQGTVFAGDGQTPVPFAHVEIYNAATNEFLTSTSTDADGFYRAANVIAGADGYRVRAYSPDFQVTAERTGTIGAQGEVLTLDLVLPVSIVRGTVFASDGVTPIASPSVFVTRRNMDGSTQSFFASVSRSDGTYAVFGVPIGDFTVTAQQPATALRGTNTGTIVDIATPVVVDVLLQSSGTVMGTVRDASGAVVASATVGVLSAGLAFTRVALTDATGVYSLSGVALGTLMVQACDPVSPFLCGLASGRLTSDGQIATLDVALPATGTVSGTILTAGESVVANAQVTIENLAYAGPLRAAFRRSLTADAAGHYESSGVPVGTVRVVASAPGEFNSAGFAEGSLAQDQTVTIDVHLGNASRFNVNLDGADGFRYDVGCQGSMGDGGTADRQLSDAYDGAYSLVIHGVGFPCQVAAISEDGGREQILGPSAQANVTVTRKVFVPAAGGFARYLDVISNAGAAPTDLTVEVRGNLGSDSRTRVVVAPDVTGSTYAVTDEGGGPCCDPALAHVFAGPGATVPASATQFIDGEDDIFYRWNVTVPAGQTVILMHFAVQRASLDTAGAQAQAEALVNLIDPNALADVTAEELARIVNFVIR
jgi:hypothetical protein